MCFTGESEGQGCDTSPFWDFYQVDASAWVVLTTVDCKSWVKMTVLNFLHGSHRWRPDCPSAGPTEHLHLTFCMKARNRTNRTNMNKVASNQCNSLHTKWPIALPACIWTIFDHCRVSVVLLPTACQSIMSTSNNSHPSIRNDGDSFCRSDGRENIHVVGPFLSG